MTCFFSLYFNDDVSGCFHHSRGAQPQRQSYKRITFTLTARCSRCVTPAASAETARSLNLLLPDENRKCKGVTSTRSHTRLSLGYLKQLRAHLQAFMESPRHSWRELFGLFPFEVCGFHGNRASAKLLRGYSDDMVPVYCCGFKTVRCCV